MTFDFRRFAKFASVVALAVTFFTSIAIGTESNPVQAYVQFLSASVLVAIIYYLTTRERLNVFDTDAFRLAHIARPILLGLMISLSMYVLLFVTFRFESAGGSFTEKVGAVFFWAILVGFTEEFVRWTWLQTLPWSILTTNAIWVMLHPQVAIVFKGGTPNVFFAVFALTFGLLMTAVMWLYESPMALGFERFLGPVLAMTLHAGFNALNVLWNVEIVIPGIGSTPFDPMAAPVLIAALPPMILLCRRAMTPACRARRAGRALRARG